MARTARRYLNLLGAQIRASVQAGMVYRWDFILDGLMGLVWAALALLPLAVFSGAKRELPGWSFAEMVIVVGWFTLLKGILDGAVNPALMAVVEHIRAGTLDFVLLKPADAQFLVSTAKFDFWKTIDVAAGLFLVGYGLVAAHHPPRAGEIAVALVLLVCACLVLYSLWILVVSAAFWVVRLDNLVYFFMSVFDFARWPADIFRGALRIVFTFVVPLALMTTYPSLALLGKLSARTAFAATGGALVFAALARAIWKRAIARYTSASS